MIERTDIEIGKWVMVFDGQFLEEMKVIEPHKVLEAYYCQKNNGRQELVIIPYIFTDEGSLLEEIDCCISRLQDTRKDFIDRAGIPLPRNF